MVRAMDRIDDTNTSESTYHFVPMSIATPKTPVIDVLHKAYPDHGIIGESTRNHSAGAEYI
jgi:hypothetical protein